MGIVRDLYYARKMSAGLKLPAPTVALLIKRLRLAAAMGGDVTKTVSGSPAHITDALAKAALSVLASIEPIQDLHGYSNPWPGGGGKNLIPTDLATLRERNTGGTWTDNKYVHKGLTFTINPDGTITINGTATADTYFSYIDASIAIPLTAGSYILHGIGSSDINVFAGKNGAWWGEAKTSNKTLTSSSDFTFSVASYIPSGESFTNFILRPMFEKGDTASAWEPNSNVCPISGLTGLSVYRRGANLLNAATNITGKYITVDGKISNGDDAQYTDLIPVTAGETYLWSLISNRAGGGNNRLHGYNSAGKWVNQIAFDSTGKGLGLPFSLIATIPNGISYVRLSYGINDTEAMFKKQNYDQLINTFYEAADTDRGPIIKDYSTPVQSPYNSWWKVGVYFEAIPGNEYAFSHDVFVNGTYVSGNRLNVGFYEKAEDVTDKNKCLLHLKTFAHFTVPNEAHYVVIEFEGPYPFTFSFVGIVKVNNDYQPYGYDEYPCDWTTQAGTVYGGTLDVVTGVLNVTHSIIDLGDVDWGKDSNRAGVFYGQVAGRKSGSYVLACSEYTVRNLSVTTAVDMYVSGHVSYGGGYIFVRDTRFASNTGAEYKAGAAGIKAVYELATPLTYQLTPKQIAALIGQNYIWSSNNETLTAVLTAPATGFAGWLIKCVTNGTPVEIPLKYMRAETYTVTPDQRMEWSAERDVTGVLHRETVQNLPPKIEFNTPLMTNSDINALNSIIKAAFTSYLQRNITIQFYDPERDQYWEWDCYMPDVKYHIRNADTANNIINYEELRYAFIGY